MFCVYVHVRVVLSVVSTRARPGQQQPESALPPPAPQPAQPTQSQTQQSQQQQQNGNRKPFSKMALLIHSNGVELAAASQLFL